MFDPQNDNLLITGSVAQSATQCQARNAVLYRSDLMSAQCLEKAATGWSPGPPTPKRIPSATATDDASSTLGYNVLCQRKHDHNVQLWPACISPSHHLMYLTISPSHHLTISPSHHLTGDLHVRHHFTISPSHHLTISPSHHLTISPSHRGSACTSPFHHLTISPSHHLTILPSHHLTISPSHHLTISPSHRLTISPSHHLTILPSHHLTISPSHHLTISPSYHLTVSPSHHLTISPGICERRTSILLNISHKITIE